MKPTIMKGLLLATALTAVAGQALADRHVRWADQAGAGKARAHQPAAAPRKFRGSERVFNRQLGSRVRADMQRRGTVAQQVRTRTAASPRVRFDTTPRRAGSGYNNVRYDRRVGQPKSILKGTAANRSVHAQRRFNQRLGASTRATMTHRGDVARHARKSGVIKSTLGNTARSGKYARTAKTLGKVGRAAAGGLVATYVAESALGVDIPDPIDAAEWTYGTLKDPSRAGQRFERLGRDSARTLEKAGRTLTNPAQMGRNLENAGKKAVKGVEKIGCSVGGLFGAKC